MVFPVERGLSAGVHRHNSLAKTKGVEICPRQNSSVPGTCPMYWSRCLFAPIDYDECIIETHGGMNCHLVKATRERS